MPDVKPPNRRIRSFILREGRLTQGQQRAFEQIWPYYGVEFDGTPLDFPRLFGNDGPVYLEIGFGDGESLAQMAACNPHNNYLGIEMHRPTHQRLKIASDSTGLREDSGCHKPYFTTKITLYLLFMYVESSGCETQQCLNDD